MSDYRNLAEMKSMMKKGTWDANEHAALMSQTPWTPEDAAQGQAPSPHLRGGGADRSIGW